MEPEDDELTRVSVSPEDDPVVTGWADVTGVFHAEVVLIGEEVRGPRVDSILSKHRFAGGGTWRRALAQCSTRR